MPIQRIYFRIGTQVVVAGSSGRASSCEGPVQWSRLQPSWSMWDPPSAALSIQVRLGSSCLRKYSWNTQENSALYHCENWFEYIYCLDSMIDRLSDLSTVDRSDRLSTCVFFYQPAFQSEYAELVRHILQHADACRSRRSPWTCNGLQFYKTTAVFASYELLQCISQLVVFFRFYQVLCIF